MEKDASSQRKARTKVAHQARLIAGLFYCALFFTALANLFCLPVSIWAVRADGVNLAPIDRNLLAAIAAKFAGGVSPNFAAMDAGNHSDSKLKSSTFTIGKPPNGNPTSVVERGIRNLFCLISKPVKNSQVLRSNDVAGE